MNLIKDNFIFLQAITALQKRQVASILKNATKDQLKTLGEIAKNILSGNLKLKDEFKVGLRRHRGIIRALADSTKRHNDRIGTAVKRVNVVIFLIKGVIGTLKTVLKK